MASAYSSDRHIIVIGASMGGIEALSELVSQFPNNLPAAIFIVQHTAPYSGGLLSQILARRAHMNVKPAEHGEPIKCGNIYIAKPDQHLLVTPELVQLGNGPKENRFRPSIDVLFRSAAVAYGARCIGVVLSGLLDDGAAGLATIKQSGGLAFVQSPDDALFPDMPVNAMKSVEVDGSLPLAQLGPKLVQVVHNEPWPAPVKRALRELKIESRIPMSVRSHAEEMPSIGDQVPFGCPDCGGPLWQVKESQVLRFRCHVGHALSAETLSSAQEDAIEKALWIALRTLEEKTRLLERLASREDDHGSSMKESRFDKEIAEKRQSIEILRGILGKEPQTAAQHEQRERATVGPPMAVQGKC